MSGYCCCGVQLPRMLLQLRGDSSVSRSFEFLSYKVDPYEIEMENFEVKLCSKLEEFLKDENDKAVLP